MKFISDDSVRAALNIDQLIRVLREAFASDISSLQMPVRTQLDLGGSTLLLMPCHSRTTGKAGIKILTASPARGVKAVYVLLDATSGDVLVTLDADYLTDVRTAAASAIATDLLARPDSTTLGVFGSGRQAVAHLTVLPHVRSFKRFLVCGAAGTDLGDFLKKMKKHNIAVELVAPEICVHESDVLCTCTTSVEPLFNGAWLRPGTHLNLVGAFQTHTREVDDETVKRSRVVVDTYEGALAEAGDILIPLRNGTFQRDHILADLHEIAAGKKSIRTGPDDITLFKSVGCALEDLVAAALAYEGIVQQIDYSSNT